MQRRRESRKVSGGRRSHQRGAHLVPGQEAGRVERGRDPHRHDGQQPVDVLYTAAFDAGEQLVGRFRLLQAELALQPQAWNLRARGEGGREGNDTQRERGRASRRTAASSARVLYW